MRSLFLCLSEPGGFETSKVVKSGHLLLIQWAIEKILFALFVSQKGQKKGKNTNFALDIFQGMEETVNARVSVIQTRRPSMVNVEEDEEEDEEKEEENREEKVECPICGEVTSDQLHYGGLACPSCKAFFRRTVALHRSPFDA